MESTFASVKQMPRDIFSAGPNTPARLLSPQTELVSTNITSMNQSAMFRTSLQRPLAVSTMVSHGTHQLQKLYHNVVKSGVTKYEPAKQNMKEFLHQIISSRHLSEAKAINERNSPGLLGI